MVEGEARHISYGSQNTLRRAVGDSHFSFSRRSLARSTTAHNGWPRLVAIVCLGSILHLESRVLVGSFHSWISSWRGTRYDSLNMGEFKSDWSAASATENASILSGVGSGEGGLKHGREGEDNKSV